MEDNQNIDTAVEAQKATAQPNEQKTEVVETPKAEQKPQEKTFTLTETQLMERAKRMAKELAKETKNESTEENNTLKAEVDSLKSELTNYKKQLAFSKYEFQNDEVKAYVDFTVSQKVGNGVDFKTALEEYMANAGKVFLKEEQPTAPNVSKIENISGNDNATSLADSIKKGAGLL